MVCPNCSFENPADARFCQNCGQALLLTCASCGTLNEPPARFCKQCGTALGSALATAPDPAAQAPLADQVAGERRIVTILFCDVKGSTALAEQLDPEEWADIMRGAFGFLTAPVSRYGGTVARLMGDGLLAFFGAPVAHEDDPHRAILAALDILKDLRPYQQRIRAQLEATGVQPAASDFEVRIGINTGLVVVGEFGSDDAGEYTAMGDAINVAARMEATAQPGTIQITNDTYRLVAPSIEVEDLGMVEVRGKKESMHTYRVHGMRASAARVRGLAGADAPLTGRSHELHQLGTALNELRTGRGQIVFLVGEAGLGKSRLLSELKAGAEVNSDLPTTLSATNAQSDSAEVQPVVWYEIAGFSYEAGQPYGLLQRLLRHLCGGDPDDPPAVTREKIAALAESVPVAHRTQLESVLQALFAVDSDDGNVPLEGEALQRELTEAMLELWRSRANAAATVVVLDDLHWADPASVALVRELFVVADGAPLLILCAFRPDRPSPAWQAKQAAETDFPHRYLELTLNPLSPADSHLLVANLLHASALPERVGALVLEKAEGNPFFVEELVRELIESGAVISANGDGWQLAADFEALQIPDTIEALLVARMDRLSEEPRRTLQLAAVIGRSFYFRVLQMIADNVEQLEEHMRVLQQMGLIREAARMPELEYEFRHALTQEAAYNTILIQQRRLFHLRTAETMERLFTDRLDAYASLLGQHFRNGGDHTRALKYYRRAADSAARLYANREAILHYTHALEEALQLGADAEARVPLHRRRGLAHETLGDFEAALADYEATLQLAEAAGDLRAQWRALLDLGKLWAARDYTRTGEYFERALALARRLDDPQALGRSLNRLGNWYANAERPNDGIAYHEEALEIFEGLDDRPGLADTVDLLGMATVLGGDAIASADYYKRAIDLYRELGNRHGLVSSLTTIAVDPDGAGTIITEMSAKEARQQLDEAIAISIEIGWKAGESYARWARGQLLGTTGRMGEALSSALAGLRIAEEINHRQWMAGAQVTLVLINLDLLAVQHALQHANQAIALAREVDSQHFISMAAAAQARAFLMDGNISDAETVLDAVRAPDNPEMTIGQRLLLHARGLLALAQGRPAAALDIADELVASAAGYEPGRIIPLLWQLKAEALVDLARTAEAITLLQEAIAHTKHTGEQMLRWRMHALLGRLYAETNRKPEAEAEHAAAREVVATVADTVADKALREIFVAGAQQVIDPKWQPNHSGSWPS